MYKKAAKKIETNSPRINFSPIEAGIGRVFDALILGVARNLQLKGQLFAYAVLGFAFSEATGLFALMMAFLLLYVA